MKKIWLILILFTAFAVVAGAQNPVQVGGAPMYPSKNIIQNVVNSADHTTLVAAIRSAGLASMLEGNGPYTIFAPTNAAFAKLPKGMLTSLMRPENKPLLTKLLTYHMVAGKWDAAGIAKLISEGGGKAEIRTVAGGRLTASLKGDQILLTDEKGGTATVSIKNVFQNNGVLYVIDQVLMPI
jgi:uncharacterized surface protein with fasciclin (FAS1) repeats